MMFSEHFKLFESLNRNSVEYLVIGGIAVAFYGEYRKSKSAKGEEVDEPDFDLWYNPNYKNYFNLLNALEELGSDVTKHRAETAPNPKKSVFRYKFEHYTLDVLPEICAQLTFNEAFGRRTILEQNGIEIPLISLEDLILDKQALGRPKDLDDIENVRRHNPPQGS